jgi:hypothetical protein
MIVSVSLKEITDEGIIIEDKNWVATPDCADTLIMSAAL